MINTKYIIQQLSSGADCKLSTGELKDLLSQSSTKEIELFRPEIKDFLRQKMIKRINETRGIGFSYTPDEEEILRYLEFSAEEVLEWIQEITTFIYQLQTPEERERKYDFKPNKHIHQDLLRKDI